MLQHAFTMDEQTQVALYQKIITGQPVPDWVIDAMLARPQNMRQKTQQEINRQREELDRIRRKCAAPQKPPPLTTAHDPFSACLNDLPQIRELLLHHALPPQYRQKVWPMSARFFDSEAADFLQFTETPQFLSKLEKLQLEELRPDEISLPPPPDVEIPSVQAIAFVKTHPLILNDLNRTLSSTQLFGESQPLFPHLCQVVACCAVRIDNYVQGLSLAAGVVLMHLMDVKETLKVMFRVMNCKVYQNFLLLDRQRLDCYSVFFFKAVVKSFACKPLLKKFKLQKMPLADIQNSLQQNLYDFLLGSLAGLVLSLFAKRGAQFSAFALDLITTAENPHECIFDLCVSYLVFVSARFLQTGNQEELINSLTKQGDDDAAVAEAVKCVWRELRGSFCDELLGLQKLVVLV